MERLRRITDLFVEGRELNLGDDDTGTPVLVWINKLNSFEDDDARRDGLAARTERLLELQSDSHEMKVVELEIAKWSMEDLITRVAAQKYEEDYLLALDDIEAEKDWAEKLDFLRRATALHEDARLSEDDKRREQFEKVNSEYMVAINEGTSKRQERRRKDLADLSRTEIEEMYRESLVQRLSMEVFLQERKVSEIFYATRDCQATVDENGYNHGGCTHERLLPDRRSVRDLPAHVIARITEALDDLIVDRRTAGNSDAPVTSSESSEQPKPEEGPQLSIPEVTAPVVART